MNVETEQKVRIYSVNNSTTWFTIVRILKPKNARFQSAQGPNTNEIDSSFAITKRFIQISWFLKRGFALEIMPFAFSVHLFQNNVECFLIAL